MYITVSKEFMKKVHASENVSPNSRGRPLGRWKEREKEYMCEREAYIRQEISVCIGIGGGSSALATHLGNIPRGSNG